MTTTEAMRSATGTLLTSGIDVGSSAVKVAVLACAEDGSAELKALHSERIRRRDLRKVISETWEVALEEAGVRESDIVYAATTGEGELVEFRRGHFYGMTTHSRGAIFLMPRVRAVLDIGALHARAMKIDGDSRVLNYRMTSQCASGSGQFLENVARYLGVALEEVGTLSRDASNPEVVSSICAVLAETDVINMVSRGIKPADILKGIHLSMAGRYVKLLRAIGATGEIALSGGLSADVGLAEAIREKIAEDGIDMTVHTHPDSVHAGAIGAALWGAFRHRVLARRAQEA
ncbi:MAG TPA: benzoyl-CoA reductase subunit D [Gammaproteobacteria bacterium]|nr:benzoyl-CoA reductase subunit D [Gammaproteobacteria bacterium]